jgi:hypothetical protein
MKLFFSLHKIFYISLLLYINLNEFKSNSLQSFNDEYSLVICWKVCVKIENCLSNRWLVCSWSGFDQKPELVCCLDIDSTQSNLPKSLTAFCEYESHNIQQIEGRSLSLSKRITSGFNAREGEFPWMASILMFGQFLCGATIISDHFVITAAHCFVPLL